MLLCRRILRLSLGLGCGNTGCGGASCCGACLRGALFRRLWLSALLRGIGLGARVRLSALLSLWLLSLWSLCVLWLWRDRRLLRLCYLLLRYRRINQAWLLLPSAFLPAAFAAFEPSFRIFRRSWFLRWWKCLAWKTYQPGPLVPLSSVIACFLQRSCQSWAAERPWPVVASARCCLTWRQLRRGVSFTTDLVEFC